MIYHVWCNCNNQQPEEIRKGVYRCQNCKQDVNPADIEDYSECPDLVEDDSAGYEYEREVAQVEYGGGRL